MVMKRSYKRQQVWNYVRENRKRFSVPHAMQQSLPLGKGGIKCFFQLLEANGLSECFEEVEVTHIARVKHYRLVKDPGFECPVFKNNVLQLGHLHAQDNLWRTMKILKTFDRYSLQVAASTEECRPGDDVTRKYLHFLMRAGYIVPIKKTPGKVWTYRFIEKENTGPNPPVVNVLNCVVDVNTNQIRYGEAV